jgi:hypothetical protein
MKQTFEQWFVKVKAAFSKTYGFDLSDLPDCPFYDWYEDGVTPISAAKRALKNSQE